MERVVHAPNLWVARGSGVAWSKMCVKFLSNFFLIHNYFHLSSPYGPPTILWSRRWSGLSLHHFSCVERVGWTTSRGGAHHIVCGSKFAFPKRRRRAQFRMRVVLLRFLFSLLLAQQPVDSAQPAAAAARFLRPLGRAARADARISRRLHTERVTVVSRHPK